MSTVYPTSYPGSPSSQTPPALPATSKAPHAGKPVITQNGRHGSFHQQRKESSYSSMSRPSFSGFSAFGGGMPMSRQGSFASLAPSDGTVRQSPSGVHRRGTGMTQGTQNTASGRFRSSGKQQKRPSDGTWATMDPDEVFRRLNVAEVKRVEAQLRTTADGKQAELRAMVSERYRDLLLSTTQIGTIHNSSLKLSQALDRIEALCSNPGRSTALRADDALPKERESEDALEITAGKPQSLSHAGVTASKDLTETDGSAITKQLPSAAAVKLLLDAPEAIYKVLSARAYLQAAFLWLLARTVKEYMLSPQEETSDGSYNQTYTPLVQKQWETLIPLRAQVVHKATASMRDLKRLLKPGQEQDRIAFVQTILTAMLLDSNTTLDALALFLGQRTKAIEDIFTASQYIRPNVSFTHDPRTAVEKTDLPAYERPKSRHTRQASRLDAAQVLRELSPAPPGAKDPISPTGPSDSHKPDRREIKRKMIRDRISKALLETIKCIASTVGMAKATYLPRPEADSDVSLLDDAIERIQRGERKPTNAQRGTVSRQVSGTEAAPRRPSRLPSNLPSIADSTLVPAQSVSTIAILKNLPSSQMLLTYLPEAVKSFTPFIAPTAGKSKSEQVRQINDKLDAWVAAAMKDLSPRIDIWLSRLDKISDIWKVRSQLNRLLDDVKSNETIALSAQQVEEIQKAAQATFETRTKAIWRAQLDELQTTTKSGLQNSLEKIRHSDNSSMTELHPSLMYFSSPMHFPSVSMGAFTTTNPLQANFTDAELPKFRLDLRTRLSHRTYLIQERLDHLEQAVAQLSKDAAILQRHRQGHALADKYRVDLTKAVSDIVHMLAETSSHILDNQASDPISVDLAMFIGRLALHMGTSIALENLRAPAKEEITSDLQKVYEHCLKPWKARTLEDALQILRKTLDADVAAITQLFSAVYNALADMVAAILDSGTIQHQRAELQKDLAIDFAKEAFAMLSRSGLSSSSLEYRQCAAFLQYLGGMATAEQVDLAIPSIKKVQLLLQPLLEHTISSIPTSELARTAAENRQSILLPFGQAPISHEYVSPTPVMKPSARFGMLSLI